ncbi:receptor like protein 22-like isoform X1 [Vicia villosa]|uniref:receptor like protein 22-like isoform X1 n=1 Tax=Vicia villosa TaxID=3911 RepID=UPI00273BAAB9|nr:receptor like protein 22-like isoform X1 [Vicia villosa]
MRVTLLSFLLCYYCIYITAVSAKCLEHQQSLLLQFKNNLTSGVVDLEQWNQGIDCCKWIGVTCDNEGQVIGLDLRQELITGRFDNSTSLFSLQKLTKIRILYLDWIRITAKGHEWINLLLPLRDLQELSLPHCGLSGPLDSSLSRLENLSVIILDGNDFSSSVPETFANFKNLTTLSLKSCGLVGTFPQKIFQIGTLSVINLSFNHNLHGSFPDYKTSKSLHEIRVRFTKFSGALPTSIGNLRKLSNLDLCFCQFNGTLPNSLSNLTHLRYLDLSSNSFTGSIPSFDLAKNLTNPSSSQFEGWHNLVKINLSNNSFKGIIPSFLFTLPFLDEINLSFNHFSKLEEFTIMSSSALYTLDLSNNNLSGFFPTSIFQLNSLYALDLSSNKITGSLQLDKLLKLRNLKTLDLSYNKLSVNGNVTNADLPLISNFRTLKLASCNLKTFPNFLINQSALLTLDLSDNQIQGIVPHSILKQQYLEELNISHNFFTGFEGPLLKGKLNLAVLDLHNNQMQGLIPVIAKSAFYLDYSTNKFSVIPQDFDDCLLRASFVSLSNNDLHGSIPHSICHTSALEVLDLSINKFSGTIPPCLMTKFDTLYVLNLRKNNLTGPIPDMFPTSCALMTLKLQENFLQGPIPKSLSHCSSLKVLDIGSNEIVDRFPCFLKNIPTLSVLILRNNEFHGSVECSVSLENKPWKMIEIFDIAFNKFNGKLPELFFTSWEKMMHDEDDSVSDFIHVWDTQSSHYQESVTVSNKGREMALLKILTIFTAIDFSSNHFEGLIPKVLMNFKAVHVLNFSNNGLSGEIPSSIENLKQLESLDLSNNSLTGEIPVQLANLSFLSYLNLSFNHLVGKIPTGTQLQSFQASLFEGNDGLYGLPLTEILNGTSPDQNLPPKPACGRLVCSIDWNFLSVELGFVFGLGIIIGPVMFWKKWRVSYWKLADKTLCCIFPWMHQEYATYRGKDYIVLRCWWH